jgi:hypothetical protein
VLLSPLLSDRLKLSDCVSLALRLPLVLSIAD